MNWFKKKPIVLNLYTYRPEVFNYFPIETAKKCIPSWYKGLPTPYYKNEEDNEVNLKLCVGVLDYYVNGFILPLWSDLHLKIGCIGSTLYQWTYADAVSHAAIHLPSQYGNILPETEYQHLKLTSPWLATCDEDIKFLLTQPDWTFDFDDNIHILSGFMDFKYQAGTNVNLFAKRQQNDYETILKAGTPLYRIVPITEREVVIKTHLVSEEKMNSIAVKNRPISFLRHYELKKKIMSSKSCPFKIDTE